MELTEDFNNFIVKNSNEYYLEFSLFNSILNLFEPYDFCFVKSEDEKTNILNELKLLSFIGYSDNTVEKIKLLNLNYEVEFEGVFLITELILLKSKIDNGYFCNV